MSALSELSAAIRARRSDMGLTQTALAKFSRLSRATINQVESGSIKDLSINRTTKLLEVLGLSLTISAARSRSREPKAPKTPALDIAARTASVSYRQMLTGEVLRSAVLTGNIPTGFQPHVNTLLEDASVSLLAAVVEQIHMSSGIERVHLWAQLRELARQLGSRRDIWQ